MPDLVGLNHTKYQRKRRAGRKRSGRYPTLYHKGWLRQSSGGQCVQGQGASHHFVRISQGWVVGRLFAFFLPQVEVKVAHLTAKAFLLSGVVGGTDN